MPSGADPILGAEKILSVFITAGAAAALAPHLVVIISGMAGGVLGLMSYKQTSVRDGAIYVLGMGVLAWLLAGTAAEIAASHWHTLDDKRLLTPVALGIGWVGHRWPVVGRWAARMARMAVEAWLKGDRGDQK